MDQPMDRAFLAAARRRIWACASAALLGVLVVPIPALAAPGSESFVTMVSEPGDYVGAGHHWFFHTGNASITVIGNAANVEVGVSGGNRGDNFTLEFAAPPGQNLQIGEYDRAQRAPFQAAGRPGIDISGAGRGCNRTEGRFRVKHIATAADGKVTSLWIVYEQHCEGDTAALFGEVRYRTPGDGGDVVLGPREVRWPETDPGSSTQVVPVIVYNPGSQPVDMAASSISGPGGAEFDVRNDECAGQATAPAKICRVFVQYLPQTPGLHVATLSIPEADGSSHQVTLEGFAFAGTTRFEIHSESNDPIGNGQEYVYNPSNARLFVGGGYDYVGAYIAADDGDYWRAGFAPRPGDVLAPGETYSGATRLGWSNGATPGLNIEGNGGGCSRLEGEFTVTEIHVDEFGELERFGVIFEQRCEGTYFGLSGVLEFRVNETVGLLPRRLVVAVNTTTAADGSGTITSSDGSIDCDSICSSWYEWGDVITLSANRATGSQFLGWSWPCPGVETCQIEMTTHQLVTGDFVLEPVSQPAPTGTQPTTAPPPQPPSVTTAKMPTAASMKISKIRERLRVVGSISPVHAGYQVTVTLFRKNGGLFHRVVRKQVTLNPMSQFATAFRRPAPGRCRLVVRFEGDFEHLSSQVSRSIAC
jgi:hypothetical protein